MEQLQTVQGFHHVYKRQLLALLSGQDTPAYQLVLVAASAIALKDKELLRQVHVKAVSSGHIKATGDVDEHMLSYMFSVSHPFELIHHRRTKAGWLVMFNELRALRPKRDSQKPIRVLHKDFDPSAFNFNKVPHESFWNGQYHGRHVSLFYNKFPIEAYHSLIVPDRGQCQEQYLQPADHALAWDLQAILSRHQPKLVIGYNAHGAGASINHLHFQLMPQMPEVPLLQHTSTGSYPIPVNCFESSDQAWRHIHRLQSSNRTFNAIYAPGRVYIIERAYQGHHQTPSWTNSFAWFELAGGILTLEERAYKTLTDDQIMAVFSDITPR